MPVPAGGGSADTLATPVDLANALQIAVEDLNVGAAQLALETSTAVVQAITRQRLVQVIDDKFELPAPAGKRLWLPEQPVTAIGSVVLGGVTLTAGSAPDMYRRITGGMYRECGWASRCGPTFVTGSYSHGYPVDSQDLQLARSASLSLAKGVYVNPDGVFSEKIDDYSVAYEKAATAMDATPFLVAALRRKYGRKAGFVAIW